MPAVSIRIGFGQMNPTVGDFESNRRKILSCIHKAEEAKCDAVFFPELAVSGYPVWDLAINPAFIAENLRSLRKIAAATKRLKVSVLTGFIDYGTQPPGAGGKTRNALAWISRGKIIFTQHKTLLPTYDVFLEEIFFEPGRKRTVIPWKGLRAGTAICEDLWDAAYPEKPLRELREKKADLVFIINGSPYHREVAELRDELLKKQARTHGFALAYVNQVGSQDDLIFDGRSLFVDPRGRILFRAPAFEEGLFIYDWNPKDENPVSAPLPEFSGSPAEMYRALVVGVRDYMNKNRFEKIVLGLSGGIDSALTAAIARDALGADRVLGVTMPSAYSSEGSRKDSSKLAVNLGIEIRNYPITGKYKKIIRSLRRERGLRGNPRKITLAMENLQARLRGLELMYISNDENRLVLTTGNKSELAMGYCTLYGDMAGGLCVLGDVYKTDVYRLARYRNEKGEIIPESTLLKPPSAELRPGQRDQDSLPPYEVLDQILSLYIEKNKTQEEISRALKSKRISPKIISEVIHRVDHNEYKRRQSPPILRVTKKAWFGRRMPITNRFRS